MTKNTKKAEQISFKEKMKDKRYNAKIQLIGYGILIVIAILYVNISNKNYNYNYPYNKTDKKNNTTETSATIKEKSLLETINNNYEYDIKIEQITEENETKNNQYTGLKYKDILSIETNNKTYYLKNNEYYEKIENDYQLTELKTIYGEIDTKYITLKEILNYLDKSSLDHTTNYSSGKIVSTYILPLKDILPNYIENDYIEFNIEENNEKLNIEIDYSSLIKQENKKVKSYKVTATYSNINQIEEFDIDIKNDTE